MGPEQRRHEPEAVVPSELDPTPLEYRPLPPCDHSYRMVNGVMEVTLVDGSGAPTHVITVRTGIEEGDGGGRERGEMRQGGSGEGRDIDEGRRGMEREGDEGGG